MDKKGFNIHFNIITVSITSPSKWFLSITSFPQNPICTSPLPIRNTCPAHLILLEFITRIRFGKEYSSTSHSLYSLLHSSVTSSALGPDTFYSTLSLCSFLNLRDEVSYPYKTTDRNKVLFILVFVFLDIKISPPSFLYIIIHDQPPTLIYTKILSRNCC